MKTHIQFDIAGNITGTVTSSVAAPDHPRQISFDGFVDTTGKRVNPETLELEDAPTEEAP